jgi:type VI secretion system secreted protein VgrG
LKNDGKSPSIQREPAKKPGVQVRSPATETLLDQFSVVHAGISGRPLTPGEVALAKPVFGNSINLSSVRIIETSISAGTTVGNVIRMHEKFDINNEDDAQTLIHELTHVWQYQHTGTEYISVSLQAQITAALKTGNRNNAYDYKAEDSKSFFDYMPEQQGFVVENYFAMKRDLAFLGEGKRTQYKSNHLGKDGFRVTLTNVQRQAEIDAEMPIHEKYVQQMQKALPKTQSQIMLKNAEEVMTLPHNMFTLEDDKSKQFLPIKPLIKVEW